MTIFLIGLVIVLISAYVYAKAWARERRVTAQKLDELYNAYTEANEYQTELLNIVSKVTEEQAINHINSKYGEEYMCELNKTNKPEAEKIMSSAIDELLYNDEYKAIKAKLDIAQEKCQTLEADPVIIKLRKRYGNAKK